jgi:hypothetical protein
MRTLFAGLCFGIALVFALKAPGSFTSPADVRDAEVFAAILGLSAVLLLAGDANA